jgi:hypothetical protein
VDLGKRKAVVVKKDRLGKITGRASLAVTRPALENHFSKQDRKSRVVVEATGNWMYLYETIEKHVPEIVLAHPLKTRAIAEARIKTDTIDDHVSRAFAFGRDRQSLYSAARSQRCARALTVSSLWGVVEDGIKEQGPCSSDKERN